ncbi:MAG: hypothetical protein ACO1SX_07060, partial [Actinomycetota bacterium]
MNRRSLDVNPQVEGRIQAALSASFPGIEASPELRKTIADAAARHDAGAVRPVRRFPRLAFGAATALAAVVGGLLLAPTLAAAYALHQVDSAISGVRSAQVLNWNVTPEGRRVIEGKLWYQNGRWRLEDPDPKTVQVCADGRLWIYRPALNRVTVSRGTSPSDQAPSGFSLRSLVRDLGRWGVRERLRILNDVHEGGRRLRRVLVESLERPERTVLYVDPKTDLLVRHEVQLEENGGWTVRMVGDYRFNEPLADHLFKPAFPKSARVVFADDLQQEWARRLEPGIVRKQVGDRSLVVRDIQVNAEGDVFLLYTAGKRPEDNLRTGNWLAGRDWEVELRDELGTRYLRTGLEFIPVYSKLKSSRPNGYTFKGERLEGEWWIPVTPQHPWKARKFTLEFRVSPVNLHGSYTDPPVTATYTETARFTLPVKGPECELVPDYMPLMGRSPGPGHEQLAGTRLYLRAHYYRYEARDQERALALYEQAAEELDATSRRTGAPHRNPQLWIELGKVNLQLGRKEAARAAFQRGVRERPPDYLRAEAEKA